MIPSPDEIATRIAELDAVAKEDYDTFEEWEAEAMERLVLEAWTVHYALRSELWQEAIDGLVLIANMCHKIGGNAMAQLPRETLLQLVRNKLELIHQHPMAVAEDFGGAVAFRFDHPVVPDVYEP